MSRSSSKKTAAARRSGAKSGSNIPWLWIGFGAAVVIVLGFAIYSLTAPKAESSPIQGIQVFENLTRNHVTTPVTYPQVPPVGGDHAPVWQNCGIYDAAIPNETGVHSLEHGAVWITYQPDLPADQLAQLKQLVSGHRYVLLSPYPGLPAPVVASAWGLQIQAQNATDPRLGQFLSRYEVGPQTPEPGAACTGGVGSPTG